MTAARQSATGAAYMIPSMPTKSGNISVRGSKNTICLVSDRKVPFCGFPIEVKNVDVIGCKKFTKVKNRYTLKNLIPNLKYASLPVPNSARISPGNTWKIKKDTTEMIAPARTARLYASRTLPNCFAP